ncbi:MAG: hypothetical protein ACLS4Z_08450 [Christensenellaceae bacterium]
MPATIRARRKYRAERANRDTVALFCHFGLESVLLSRLNVLHSAGASFRRFATSVTTLYTEERRKGQAIFRCRGFGETTHLYLGGETPSFSARFCEIFDSDERHD